MANIPELVGMAETADILGFSRSNFGQHRRRYDRPDDPENPFPQPVAELRCGPIWKRSDIDKWAKVFAKLKRPAVVAKPAEKSAPAGKKVVATKKVAPVAKKSPPTKAAAPVKKTIAKKVAAPAKKTLPRKAA